MISHHTGPHRKHTRGTAPGREANAGASRTGVPKDPTYWEFSMSFDWYGRVRYEKTHAELDWPSNVRSLREEPGGSQRR